MSEIETSQTNSESFRAAKTETQESNSQNTEKSIEVERREYSSIPNALNAITPFLERKLQAARRQPLVIFVNGAPGAGKTYFAEELTSQLKQGGHTAVFVETDLYGDGERFSTTDFAQQKAAWESGQPFVYHNTQLHQDQSIDRPDVVIIGGINASEQDTHIANADLKIALTSPFLNRLAQKGWRDFVVNRERPDPDAFLNEICNATSDPTDDLLLHLQAQETEADRVIKTSNVIVHNERAENSPRLWVDNELLHFAGNFQGQQISAQRPISAERIRLLQSISAR